MIVLYSLVGIGVYIFFAWYKWSNQVDHGENFMTTDQWLYDQRQEFVGALVGAILFMIGGEGLIDSLCDVVGYIWSDDASELCISIQVNLEELIYIIGGASFSSILLFGIKYSKKKAKKKMDEI